MLSMNTTIKPWAALCIVGCVGFAGVATFEGLRTKPYLDVAGVPTVCYGETEGVVPGEERTPEECMQALQERVQGDFSRGVDLCVGKPLPDARKAAYVSLTYNIGINAFCNSTVVRREKAGDAKGACDAILMWDKIRINGKLQTSRGLQNRRQQERSLCLQS